MFSAKVNLSDVARNLVPGFIVVAGIWYLYQPFLQKLVPFIIIDIIAWSSQTKIIFCILLCLIFGFFYDSISDTAVPVIADIANKKEDVSLNLIVFCLVRAYAYMFSFSFITDPRVASISKYLDSVRNIDFKQMCLEWGLVSNDEIENDDGKILAHQHIVTRLKAYSELSSEAERVLTNHYQFTCSIYFSVLTLFGLIMTSFIVDILDNFKYFGNIIRVLALIALVYICCLSATTIVKKRTKYYYLHILTIALHFFMESKDKRKDGGTVTDIGHRAN